MNFEIKLEDTWKLEDIFKTLDDAEIALSEAKSTSLDFIELKEDFTNNGKKLLKAFKLYEKLSIKLSSCYVYAKMLFDQDMSSTKGKAYYEKCDAIGNTISESCAFFIPRLSLLDESKWLQLKTETPELKLYDFFMSNLFEEKKHILSEKEEELLTKMNSLGNSFNKAYDDLTVNDMQFELVETPEGKTLKADNTNYAKALINPNRKFRETYFKSLLKSYKTNINTLTSLYYGSVKNDVFVANSRNYNSSLEMALDSDKVDLSVYQNLIDTVSQNKKVLEDYLNYRKSELNLEHLHFYDLFVPLTEEVEMTFTFEEAKNLVLEATKILGEEYQNVLKEAFENRWIDRYPREYKDSGAYAIHTYGYHPFSLMNFTGTLNDVFTLAHELGHVMHSYFSMKHQPYIYSEYTIFTAEVASTVNEQLLFHHIYKNAKDKNTRRYLLASQLDNIRSTFFRQTLFADFEWQAHQKVESNEPLTPEILETIYKECYQKYHGNSLEIDELLLSEWARIPHFYRAYYVYQYATGISAAIAISAKLLNKEPKATENYLSFLKTGGSDYPINLLKIAGVDMASPEPILATLETFGLLLKELKNL